MKKCPQCNQIFDDINDYCLNDGTPLVFEISGFHSSGDLPTQFIPQSRPIAATQVNSTSSSSKWLFPVLGILCGLVVVFGYFAFFKNSPSSISTDSTKEVAETTDKQTPTPRKVETTPVPPPPVPPPDVNTTSYPIVIVNSPRDNYLALKSEPCVAPCGTTLIKIPHGTRLALGTCTDTYEFADRKRGRWCYVTYAGQTGWIFDGFVIYQ